jgi:hypothetical protein
MQVPGQAGLERAHHSQGSAPPGYWRLRRCGWESLIGLWR